MAFHFRSELMLLFAVANVLGCEDRIVDRQPVRLRPHFGAGLVDAAYVPIAGKRVPLRLRNPLNREIRLVDVKASCGCVDMHFPKSIAARTTVTVFVELEGSQESHGKNVEIFVSFDFGAVARCTIAYWTGKTPSARPYARKLSPGKPIWRFPIFVSCREGFVYGVGTDSVAKVGLIEDRNSNYSIVESTLFRSNVTGEFPIFVEVNGTSSGFSGGHLAVSVRENETELIAFTQLEDISNANLTVTPRAVLHTGKPQRVLVHYELPGRIEVGIQSCSPDVGLVPIDDYSAYVVVRSPPRESGTCSIPIVWTCTQTKQQARSHFVVSTLPDFVN